MSEEIYKPRNESESNGLELAKFAIDNAQKFNDKTIALFL